jgi:hypothetical protein
MAPTILDALMMMMGLGLAVVAIFLDRSERTLSIWKSAIPVPLLVDSRTAAASRTR